MEQTPPRGGLEMRVAHLADSHLDEKQDLEDNVRVHDAAIDEIQAARVDLIVHPGDIHQLGTAAGGSGGHHPPILPGLCSAGLTGKRIIVGEHHAVESFKK